ncbi:hypothetical protein ACUODJ_34305, partial [Escherichia sp. HC-CC]
MSTILLPKTQHLVVFQEVIRSGSIGSAAKELGLTIFYGDNIIRYVVNIKKGLRPYFKQLPDNYQAKFE